MISIVDEYEEIVNKYGLNRPSSIMKEASLDLVRRVNVYINTHSKISVRRIAELFGASQAVIAKWQQRGYVIKTDMAAKYTRTEIMQGTSTQNDIKAPFFQNEIDENRRKREHAEKMENIGVNNWNKKKYESRRNRHRYDADTAEQELADMTITDIRNKIKIEMCRNLTDARAVASYAEALRKLEGVNDRTFVEPGEDENGIVIYVPAEREDEEATDVDIDRDEFE